MISWWNKMLIYFGEHVALNAWAHSCAGFGLAIILQHYLKGNSFVPIWFGWALLSIATVIHIMAFA